MTESNSGTEALIKAARAAAETFLAVLDGEAGQAPAKQAPSPKASPAEPIQYDPLTDEPPFAPDPGPGAALAAQQLAWLTYLGALARINASEGRGANSKEVTKFAKKAGYSDGKSVNGWNDREGSTRSIKNLDGARYVHAHAWLTELADDLGIEITGDITPLPIPV